MNKFSKYALCICYLIMFYTALVFYPKWNQNRTEATLSWDASGYYMYLPSIFIYNDITKCTFKDSILKKYQPTPNFQQAFIHEPSGNYVMKYSCGQAITMLPWFGLAHSWAIFCDKYPPDGFSFPYQLCIGLGMFLYALLGLFYLRKLLLKFFKDSTVAIVLLLLIVGTNYLNYSSIDQAMTHSNLFVVYVLILWNTLAYYQNPNTKKALTIGLFCGLATLIRPTEIISILIPLLWGISSFNDIKKRWKFISQHFLHSILFIVIFICFVSIQPIYWKLVTTNWIVYSYQDQGFSWLNPHIKDYLISYSCGWLRYCPMMVIPYIGLISFWRRKENILLIYSFSFLSLYYVSAWDVWDYGGTAGRAMVQYYPILAFPFASLIEKINTKLVYKLVFYLIIILFIYLNLWWLYNAHHGNVQVSYISKEYYWKMIGRWNATENDTKLLDNKDSYYGIPKNVIQIYSNDFSTDTSQNSLIIDSKKVVRVNNDLQYSAIYILEKPKNLKKWIRVLGDFKCTTKEWDVWRQTQFIVKFHNNGNEVQTNLIRVQRFLNDGEKKEIYLDAIVPTNCDKISVQLWNADNDKELILEKLKIITFDP